MKGDKWRKKNELLERRRRRRRKGVNSQDRNEILLGNRRKWRRINREIVKYKEIERTEGSNGKLISHGRGSRDTCHETATGKMPKMKWIAALCFLCQADSHHTLFALTHL